MFGFKRDPADSQKRHSYQIDWDRIQTVDELKPFLIAAMGGPQACVTEKFLGEFPQARKFLIGGEGD